MSQKRIQLTLKKTIDIGGRRYSEGYSVSTHSTVEAVMACNAGNQQHWDIKIHGHEATHADIIALGQGKWKAAVAPVEEVNEPIVDTKDEGDKKLSLKEDDEFPAFGKGAEELLKFANSHGVTVEQMNQAGSGFTAQYNWLREQFGLESGKDSVSFQEAQEQA